MKPNANAPLQKYSCMVLTGQPTDTLKLRLIASRVPLRKEFDEGTGLYYYGARYYDPRISLWLNNDPNKEEHPVHRKIFLCTA